jgi:hypothetical protein
MIKYFFAGTLIILITIYSFVCPRRPKNWDLVTVGMSVYDPYFQANWSEIFQNGKIQDNIIPRFRMRNGWAFNGNANWHNIEFDKDWKVVSVKIIDDRNSGIFKIIDAITDLL